MRKRNAQTLWPAVLVYRTSQLLLLHGALYMLLNIAEKLLVRPHAQGNVTGLLAWSWRRRFYPMLRPVTNSRTLVYMFPGRGGTPGTE